MYVVTAVDRATHAFVGYVVVAARTRDVLQEVVDQAPQAGRYFSDGFLSYRDLVYGPAQYRALPDKSETYSVEGGNADLRIISRASGGSRAVSHAVCRH